MNLQDLRVEMSVQAYPSGRPNQTLAPTSMTDLPTDILRIIASLVDERTVWAMRRVHPAITEAADLVLKPYLTEKIVAPRSLFMTSPYTAISAEDFTKDTLSDADEIRAAELIETNERFFRHIAAYPPSIEHLRSLTVELRDYDAKRGWRVLRRFLSQLEHLTVHAFHHPGPYNSEGARNAVTWAVERRWTQLLRGLHVDNLPNLTTLHIDASAVVLDHFHGLASLVPNLRHLRLGNYWSDHNWPKITQYDFQGRFTCDLLSMATDDILDEDEDAPIGDIAADGLSEPAQTDKTVVTLGQLERVDLSGGLSTRWRAVNFLPAKSPNVRYLTVNFDESMPSNDDRSGPVDFVGMRAAEWAHLEGIAAYGEWAERLCFATGFNRVCLRKDKSKVLGPDKLVSLTYEQDSRDLLLAVYPLMDYPFGLPAEYFSSLDRITWVIIDRSTPQASTDGEEERNEGEEAKLYNDAALRKLFAQFKTLRSVEWVSGYPADPFAEHDPSTWAAPNVICWIPRPEQDRDGQFEAFEPVYPPRK